MRRLLKKKHAVGLLQSGVEQELEVEEASKGLVSLGSLYFVPAPD